MADGDWKRMAGKVHVVDIFVLEMDPEKKYTYYLAL